MNPEEPGIAGTLSSEAEEPEKVDKDPKAHLQHSCQVAKRKPGMELLSSEEWNPLRPNCFNKHRGIKDKKIHAS